MRGEERGLGGLGAVLNLRNHYERENREEQR